MTKFSIRKESIPYILILALIALGLYFLLPTPIFIIIPIILILFILYFFRDPYREVDFNEKTFISPADGTVMDIRDIYEEDFIKGNAKKVTIFLSVFNVHINRCPIAGEVTYSSYRPGKYLPAFKPHASEENERNTIGIENKFTKALVHQITGLIARRIVCWNKEGDTVEQGEKFGLIKFGSCTELIVPDNVKILVKKGDVVRGGITILGVIDDE
ncbi:phosphatidylserine decarboxylase family protein [Clostridium cylindrosporum]|uniref:Phosphatidylserine decarboxylase proenzyme n=1 Tax=Clostridium cylindrosporum DSM 605 TaxID=1121307 RepID=A0A0J8FYY4_CLOCY|nr:phosphatidylserine decarboxylase family protein [Clostridium cylindrosporum]KMT20831.1 phosphatidylserine decarboxylase proenzyme [Clostridium cylindrosporum DSM 605]